MLALQVLFGTFVIVSYVKSYKQTERFLTPHPLMLSSLLS
jgi:hypothetical protein